MAVIVYDTVPNNPVRLSMSSELPLRGITIPAVFVTKEIGEEIFYNAPSFFYSGKMKAFNPKEYKRLIVGFNFFKQDCIRLIFLTGAQLNDTSGLLTGDYKDGRRVALFYSMDDVKKYEKTLQKLLKKWLKLLDK